jgi:hypothetical protein
MANIMAHSGANIDQAVTVCALPEQISGEIITKAFTKDEIGRVLNGDSRVRIVYENTLNLSPEDLDGEDGFLADLCIIDACHDLAYVINDLDLCIQELAIDGVIMLHDVYPGSQPYLALQSRMGVDSQLIIRTLPGTWWAVAAWASGWKRLETWMGRLA